MEKYNINKDINLLCVQAESFPDGIKPAFQKLEKIVGDPKKRDFYGISYPDGKGSLVYKAAAEEEFDGEAKQKLCESFVVRKGTYLTETIMNFMENIPLIGETFDRLLTTPELDQTFPCVEWYKSDKEVVCMVRLKD